MTTDVEADDATLVARLAAGDRDQAVIALYRRYGGRLYGLGMRLLGDPGMAEELVQETFVRLWRGAGRFDSERSSVRGYLYMIARRAAVDMRRRPAARPLRDLEADSQALVESDGANDAFEDLRMEVDVRDALDSLSDEHREVLELRYREDLTQRQIAERLAIPLGTVKTRSHYALRALKPLLEERDLVA